MSSPITFPAGFDKALALEAAGLVNQAYAEYLAFKAHDPNWRLQGPYDDIAHFSAEPQGILGGLLEKVEPFGFVARKQGTKNIFVVFRGTQSPGDLLSDISFTQTSPSWQGWGKVEGGFWKLYRQCSASVINGAKAAGAGANVFVTGHSLGSAMATLAVADLVNAGIASSLYVFASPRVGDLDFATKFNGSVAAKWRVTNTEDIVTTVPLATAAVGTMAIPKNLFSAMLDLASQLNFEHVGTPVSFTDHKGSVIGNHGMATYVAALGG